MARQQQSNGAGGYVAVAIIALLIGRCTAGEDGSVQPVAAFAPARLPTIQTSADEDDAVIGDASEPEVEPDTMPSDRSDVEEPADDEEPSDIYYRNCSAARAAGAAPIHVGEPGYASHLDRDDDGVACE